MAVDNKALVHWEDLGLYNTAIFTKINSLLNALKADEAVANKAISDSVGALETRLNALADSDDETLDQLSEIVAYIKANKGLIEGVTTSKVNVADIVDDLITEATNKPLSAKQGKVLNDAITTHTGDTTVHITAEERTKWNSAADSSAVTDLSGRVETVEAALAADITADDITALVNGTTTGGEEPTA